MSGSGQTFVLAMVVVIGTFAYLLTITILRMATDPTILPILAGSVGTVLSYFFSTHIANGAATKALDVLVQTGRERETALSDAQDRSETSDTAGNRHV